MNSDVGTLRIEARGSQFRLSGLVGDETLRNEGSEQNTIMIDSVVKKISKKTVPFK